MTASFATTLPQHTYREERLNAPENLTTPLARFEQAPRYRTARAEFTAKLERLVDDGRIARTEADTLDELTFGMANSRGLGSRALVRHRDCFRTSPSVIASRPRLCRPQTDGRPSPGGPLACRAGQDAHVS